MTEAAFEQPSIATDFPPVGELVTTGNSYSPETIVDVMADVFFKSASTDAVALVEDGRAVGLLTRQKFLFSVFRRFGWELFGRKPVRLLAESNPLTVDSRDPLDLVLQKALRRDPESVYDDLIVTTPEGRYAGLLSVKQLVLEQSFSLANILVQRELATARAKEVEEVGRMKSEFLANVTHELRSPVNAIIELTELIRIAADHGRVSQLNDRLGLLLSSATNLRSIITNILDLSKLEAGRMQVIAEEFDLVSLLREVTETTEVLVAAKPINVELATGLGELIVRTDPVKVRQIVLNLTSNAAKFTESGSIVVELEVAGEEIRIAVTDTGIGIAGADVEKLFEAFAQVAEARTKQVDGTGLGLTIVRQLSGMLGGSVRVESELGRGSTFEVSLPRRLEEKES